MHLKALIFCAFFCSATSLFGQDLSQISKQNITIVSGLAIGIDSFSHIEALKECGSTIAVLGSAINEIYPRSNINIYKQIEKTGLIISEFPIGTKYAKENFPQRNRIISGLSFCTIVVEAGDKSGSLITANYALSQNRDVYCFPNYIDTGFNGTNVLIKEGAGLITDVDLFCQELKTIEISWKNIYYCKGS